MKPLRQLGKFLVRLIMVWCVDAVTILLTASLLPGMTIDGDDPSSRLAAAASAALVLGIVNMLIQPIFLLLTRPMGGVAILVLGFFLNAIVFKITSGLIPSFEITNFSTMIGLIALLVAFIANWMGACIALKINGWKSLLLPVRWSPQPSSAIRSSKFYSVEPSSHWPLWVHA